jgi:phosphate transport system substrate-binding protein
VLSALVYAHAAGLVHRDVKPSNILMDKSGRALLTDFGIALVLSDSTRLTRTGTAVGTAMYMSPEQILRPKSVEKQTDIYSFGCVLYAMLTGTPPFGAEGETDFYIKDCHVRSTPPPLLPRNPDIPRAVEEVALRCLEKDPAKRYESCGAVMAALDAAISGRPLQAPAPVPAPVPSRSGTMVENPAVAPPAPAPTPAPAFVPVQPPSVAQTPPPVPRPAVPVEPPRPQKRRGLLFGGLAAVLVLAAAGVWYWINTPGETILSLEGSTTVGDELAPKMLMAFLKNEGATGIKTSKDDKHRDVIATLPGHWRSSLFSVLANGSPNAFTALAAGRVDIGMASRPVKDAEVQQLQNLGDMRDAACEHVLALDGIAVIVNTGNPLQSLTRQQIADIFRGRFTDWSEVGGHPGPIQLYGRTEESGTFDTFNNLVLGGKKDFASNLEKKQNGEEIAQAVASNPNGIGYVGLAQIGSARALQVSDGGLTARLQPSPFTVATEDYVLSRRLFLYTPAKPSEWVQKFVKFALSDEGQKVVAEVGYIEMTPRFDPNPPKPAHPPFDYQILVQGKRRVAVNFRFLPNSTKLDTRAQEDIHRLADFLREKAINEVWIMGFADSVPPPPGKPSNQQLSEQRAQAVKEELQSYTGTSVKAFTAGFSAAVPLADDSTPEGRQKNRRAEVWTQ